LPELGVSLLIWVEVWFESAKSKAERGERSKEQGENYVDRCTYMGDKQSKSNLRKNEET
jgi:hypothetical protein